VIWIRLGNCATADLARMLRFRVDQIHAFVADTDAAFLAVG
jgi:predicted nuclease of predicted toxin-antitoxin system